MTARQADAGLGRVRHLWFSPVRFFRARLEQPPRYLGALVPLAGNAWYVNNHFQGADPTPMLFCISLLALRPALFGGGLLDTLPVSHHQLLEQLPLGVILTDRRNVVVDLNPAAEVRLGIAESIEPNADGTEWTIVLREATFHDGRPLTSADVAYTLRTYTDPEVTPIISSGFSMVDAANISTPDARTVVVPLTIPRGDFLDAELAISSFVLPEGSLGGPEAIGTGAFKLEAYEASSSIRMVRNADYWNTPPLLDELEIVVVNDPTARLNALKGGEVEFARGITPAAARAEDGNDEIVLHRGGAANSQAMGFAANITLPPFDNPDAVRALKLAIDRQALVDTVLLGFGVLGNDLVGKGLPGYADAIPQTERDVQQARALFESAGVTELTMLTGETTAGTVAAAELLVQQLAEAGVTLTLDELPADQYYSDFGRLFSTPLQSCWWVNRPADVHLTSYTGSNAGFNLTGIGGAEYDALLASAQVSVDRDERLAVIQQLQQHAFDHDGMVIWGFREDLNASVPGLTGVSFTQSSPRFHRASLEA